MKPSKIMHVLSGVVGLIGVVMFFGALKVPSDGMVYGITKMDALACVAILILFAIWIQIATIHHMMLEKHGGII